jgi:RNA polymerase sigma-70 factor (ECF subfamily)
VKGFSGRRDYLEITDLSDLVNLHGKAVYGFCHYLTKNKVDTDDLYQETFLKAAELCHKIDKGNNTKAFLVSIAIGLWKNNRRKYARRQRIAPIEELNENVNDDYIQNESSPEDIVISNELRNIIQAAAEKLDYKLRIPLYMYYTAEMSNEDMAHALKIPQGTVKSRLYKARKTLKNILEVSGYEEF